MPTCLLLRTSAFDSLCHHSLLAQPIASLQTPARKLEKNKIKMHVPPAGQPKERQRNDWQG